MDTQIDTSLAYCVKPDAVWTPNDFHEMLFHLDAESLGELEKTLGLESPGKEISERIGQIKKELIWKSSHFAEYFFKKAGEVDYHGIVQWVAEKQGISKEVRKSESTFILERLICEQLFKSMWENLPVEQRRELLEKIDVGRQLDVETIATMGGTAALATLSTTVYFAGFAFYTTLTTTICSVAGFFGITLPFGAYVGTTSAVAFLTGPVGWSLIAIGAVGSLALLGKANLSKTTPFVVQFHSMKVAALQSSGWEIPEPRRTEFVSI